MIRVALTDPGGVGRQNFLDYLNFQKGNDKQLRDILRKTQKSVGKEVARIPGNSISDRIRRAQYEQVRGSIVRQEAEGWTRIGRVIEGNIAPVSNIATDGSIALLDILGSRVPPELIASMQAAAETSGERLAARIASQIDLSPRVYSNAALTAGKVDAIINDAISLNQSAKELAARVAVYISPDTPGGMSYAAMRLGRTELNNAYHATNTILYNSQPWVEGAKWRLSGSHPKPDECNEFAEGDNFGMGEGVYPTGMIPAKPHPQCLCYTVPVTPSRKDFVDNLLSGQYNGWLEENGLEPL